MWWSYKLSPWFHKYIYTLWTRLLDLSPKWAFLSLMIKMNWYNIWKYNDLLHFYQEVRLPWNHTAARKTWLTQKKMFLFFFTLFVWMWNSYMLLLLLCSVKKKTFCHRFLSKEELIWHERTEKTEKKLEIDFLNPPQGEKCFCRVVFRKCGPA